MEVYSEMQHVFQIFYFVDKMSMFAMYKIKEFIQSTEKSKMEAFDYTKDGKEINERQLKDPYLIVLEERKELDMIKKEFPEFQKHLPKLIERFKPESDKLNQMVLDSQNKV